MTPNPPSEANEFGVDREGNSHRWRSDTGLWTLNPDGDVIRHIPAASTDRLGPEVVDAWITAVEDAVGWQYEEWTATRPRERRHRRNQKDRGARV